MNKLLLPLALAACFNANAANPGFFLVIPLSAKTPTPTGSVSLSPSRLSFSNIQVGYSSAAELTIRNTGTIPQALGSIQITENPSEFQVAHDCPGILAAGGQCTATVSYQPNTNTAPGQLTVALDPAGSRRVSLLGTSTAVEIQGSENKDLGTVIVGQSAAADYMITNSGSASANLAFSVLPGTLTRDGSCGSALPAGASCAVTLVWRPSAPGPLDSTLNVAAGSSSVALRVTGQAVSAAKLTGGSSQEFGSIFVGESSTKTWTITNTGQSQASLSYGTLPSDITKAGTCSNMLAGGSSCTIALTWSPSSAGVLAPMAYSVSDQKLEFSGVSVAKTSTATATPTSHDFGQMDLNQSTIQAITLTNTGNQALILPVNVGTGLSAPYSVSDDCGTSLIPGASCTATVTYTPTASGGTSQLLTINAGAAGTKLIQLSGTGKVQGSTYASSNCGGAGYCVSLVNTSPYTITSLLVGDILGTGVAEDMDPTGGVDAYTVVNGQYLRNVGFYNYVKVNIAPGESFIAGFEHGLQITYMFAEAIPQIGVTATYSGYPYSADLAIGHYHDGEVTWSAP